MAMWALLVFSVNPSESDAAKYKIFRYTGTGIANPERDREIVKGYPGHFNQVISLRERKEQDAARAARQLTAQKKSPEERTRRISELQAQLQETTGTSRGEELKRKMYENELAALRSVDTAPSSDLIDVDLPVVLIDAMPGDVRVENGGIVTSGTEVLGQFTIVSADVLPAERLLERVQALAISAGGNVVSMSYVYLGRERAWSGTLVLDQTGQCHGAVGYILKARKLDPASVRSGKLPTEI